MLEDRTQLYKRLRWEYEHGLGTIRGRPKIQSTSSDRSSSTAERLATKAQSDAERTAENGVGHSVRRCRPGNNLKATFGNQLTAHQVCVHMQVEMPGCDIGESTVRAYVRVRKAELDEQQTSQAAAAWMMEVLHRDVPLRFIEREFPSGATSSLAGIRGPMAGTKEIFSCSRLLEGHPHSGHCSGCTFHEIASRMIQRTDFEWSVVHQLSGHREGLRNRESSIQHPRQPQ
jgi:hypothetical protein